MVEAQMCFNCGETFDEISMTQEELDKYAREVEKERGEKRPDIFEQFREKRDEELNNLRRIVAENTARKKEIEARYECLLEMSQEMEQKGLKCLILFPNLLTFLYFRWMKKEDSYAEELEDCVKEEIIKMKSAGENVKGR